MQKSFHILLLVITTLIVSSCVTIQPIEISQFRNFEIAEFKDNTLTLKANLEVNNPNPLRMKVVNANFDLKINDKIIGHLSQMDPLTLEAKTKKEYPVLAKFEITSLKNGILSLMQLVNRRDAHISVSGSITGKTMFYRKKFDFTDIKIYQ
jgi:LEA14-like dessication related protein